MKFKYLLIAVLAGAALVGCNKEAGKDVTGTEQDGEKRYMGFTISMPSAAATKAENTGDPGTFVLGEDYENAVNTIHFLFYRDGAYVSYGYGDMEGKFTETPTPAPAPGNPVPNIEIKMDNGSAKGVIVLESTMTMPNQVLCIINSRGIDWYRNKSLDQVLAAKHTGAGSCTNNDTDTYKDFVDVSGPYFVMFTSPMYGSKKGSSTKEVKYVSDIDPDVHIHDNKKDAENNPLDIYVERLAARVELVDLDKDGDFIQAKYFGNDMKKEDTVTPLYDIKVLGWGVTAVNNNSFSVKQIDINWFSQTDANKPFNGGWLESGEKVFNPFYPTSEVEKMFTRINWAKDVNYGIPANTNREAYPHSARELGYDDQQLHYWSANEILAHYNGAEKSLDDILQRYCYENTLDKEAQANPRINGTMLLLYAQAMKKGEAAQDLYAYMGQIYTSEEYANHLMANVQIERTFYKKDGTDYKPLSTADLKVVKAAKIDEVYGSGASSLQDDLNKTVTGGTEKLQDVFAGYIVDLSGELQLKTIEPNFTVIPTAGGWSSANKARSYADGYVTLLPTKDLYVENETYDPADPASEQYRPATNKEVIDSFLHDAIEPANRYTQGKMYYAIPLEHFGKAKTADPDNPELLEGNYGVLRNNLYRVSVNKINTLGHGIDDLDEPIVPGNRKKPYYISAKINILSWQLATQSHDLAE